VSLGAATDDALFAALEAALRPPPVEPTYAELLALRRAVEAAVGDGARPALRLTARFRRPLACAAAALLLAGASAAAATSGAKLPRPVRVAARVFGLPVESPALADARAAIGRLHDVLEDRPLALGEVRAAAAALRARLAALSADERAGVDAEAAMLLARADAALVPPPPAHVAPAPRPAPSPPTSAPSGEERRGPGPSTTVASGDDHSGPRPSPSSGDDHTATTVPSGDRSGHVPDGSGDGTPRDHPIPRSSDS
jgi:hypothetical protein